jgi:hypothetical protein
MRAVDAYDAFIPGLEPRGHEDVLGLSARDVLARLPRRAGWVDERVGYVEETPEVEVDAEVVREYLRRRLE